jgi:hypothetical protein
MILNWLWDLLPEGYSPDEIETWLEWFLNRILEMDQFVARIRGYVVLGSLFLIWTIIGFVLHPFNDLPNALVGLLVPANVPGDISPTSYLFTPIFRAYFSLDVLVHILAMLLPFYLALEFASIYQADIYKLPRTGIARAFITRAVFNLPGYETLNIASEKLTPEQQRSTIHLIGGPGIVNPQLEFATVFERINGNPHFIRAGMTREQRTLAGFERLRRIIDTRNHTFHYDNITGRTKDGIKIQIQDINLLFSLYRPSANYPLANPYPTTNLNLYWLTYRQPAKYWVNVLTELVRDYLLCFIRMNTFGSLLAAVGEPEIENQIAWENTLNTLAYGYPLTQPLTFIYDPDPPLPPLPPTNIPRPRISNFFKGLPQTVPPDFNCSGLSANFTLEAQNRGLRLEWINVGTWNTPSEVMLEQHVEAWRLTNENLTLSNPFVLQEFSNQARIRELTRAIQQVPLLTFASVVSQNLEPQYKILTVLREYYDRIRVLRGKYIQAGEPVPDSLEGALLHINRCLTNWASQTGTLIG